MRNFFRKRNLIALRELALRRTAERVDAEMELYRRAEGVAEPWAVRERILVCIGDPDMGLKLVRSARRMMAGLKAQWIVAHVETPAELRWPKERRDFIVDVIGFAQDMGAETVALQGIRVADEILALARQRNVSRILVGKPGRPHWRQLLEGSVVETLVRRSREMDVYVISGEAEGETPPHATSPLPSAKWGHYLQAVGVVLAATAIAFLMHTRFELTNLVMVYLLGVMVVALWLGRGPGIVASILSVAAFDFCFVSPRFTLAVSDTQYLVTFATMLVAALALSTMANWLRVQTDAARRRELRTGALYRLARELASLRSSDEVLAAAARTIGEEFEGRAAVLLPEGTGRLRLRVGDLGTPQLERAHEEGVAQWVFDNGHSAGVGTDTLPAARGLYVPLTGSRGPIGVAGLSRPGGPLRPDQFRFLEAMASQVALAVERAQLAEQAEHTRVQIEIRASQEHAAQLRVARLPHATGGHYRGGHQPARALRYSRRHASGAHPHHRRRGRAARTAGEQPARHDTPGVGRAPGPQGVALARGGGGRGARALRRRRSRGVRCGWTWQRCRSRRSTTSS